MLGQILEIENNIVKLKLNIDIYKVNNLIGKNVVFLDNESKLIGEILSIGNGIMNVNLIGQIIGDKFIYGNINNPSFMANCSFITDNELSVMLNNNSSNYITIGKSYVYKNYPISLDINTFFANHFAILGNSGSGKSYAVTKILQSLYSNNNKIPSNSNIFLFDAYGEYQKAFSSNNMNYKVFTTDLKSSEYENIKIPFWLLSVDDICLLLNITKTIQIPVIEKALKLVKYFTLKEEEVLKEKNDIIARALLEVIFSGKNPTEIRNKLTTILTKFNTTDLNLEVVLAKGGWNRSIRQCIYVDSESKFADIEVVIAYLETLLIQSVELSMPDGSIAYTIENFADALDFALISEGTYSNEDTYNYVSMLKIRLNSLINSEYKNYFEFDGDCDKESYFSWLLSMPTGGKAQIVNFNINYVDDRFAKILVKIYSKLLFDYGVNVNPRASIPIHIILEEAHRYVQNDTDVELIGYNIFERITKEGRKYGVILGLISQRPSEISQTAISQCSNFLIFKMFHPTDLEFIKYIIPTADEIFKSKLKMLSPGTCILFGSAFRMPIMTVFDKPNPEPMSASCDINVNWY